MCGHSETATYELKNMAVTNFEEGAEITLMLDATSAPIGFTNSVGGSGELGMIGNRGASLLKLDESITFMREGTKWWEVNRNLRQRYAMWTQNAQVSLATGGLILWGTKATDNWSGLALDALRFAGQIEVPNNVWRCLVSFAVEVPELATGNFRAVAVNRTGGANASSEVRVSQLNNVGDATYLVGQTGILPVSAGDLFQLDFFHDAGGTVPVHNVATSPPWNEYFMFEEVAS